jgi:hypothetical protein
MPTTWVRLSREYPTDSLNIAPGQWLLADPTTAIEVTKKLGLWLDGKKDPEALPTALVAAISSYSGLMRTDVWEWMRSRSVSS